MALPTAASGREARERVLGAPVLVAVTLAVLVLLGVRTHYEPELNRYYIVWNLFLAWVPYVCARVLWRLAHRPRSLFLLLPLVAVWLAFLPNAPYLVTDLVHLHHPGGFRVVLEVALFGSVAIAGVLLGVASVQPVHRLAAERLGPLAAGAFPPVIALAVAFGVYLGRVQRWNSWELFETPGSLLHATWTVLGHPADHPRAVGGIALFTLAFLAAYLALTTERGSFGAPQHHA